MQAIECCCSSTNTMAQLVPSAANPRWNLASVPGVVAVVSSMAASLLLRQRTSLMDRCLTWRQPALMKLGCVANVTLETSSHCRRNLALFLTFVFQVRGNRGSIAAAAMAEEHQRHQSDAQRQSRKD